MHSGYKLYSGILNFSHHSQERDISLSYFGGIGEDVGKPERGNDPQKYNVYPYEANHFIRLSYLEKNLAKDGSSTDLYTHTQTLTNEITVLEGRFLVPGKKLKKMFFYNILTLETIGG